MKYEKMRAEEIRKVVLQDDTVTLEEFAAVARYHARVVPGDAFMARIDKSRALVERFLDEERPVYGVTTGVGDNVKYAVSREEASVLQKNMLRTHAVSVGEALNEEEARAIIFMIILNAGKGFSAIKRDTMELLCEILNHNLIPYAPRSGSVGYLSVEAHMALTLIGEGYFLVNGNKVSAASVLEKERLTPVTLGCKEGLVLITGTTSSTAYSLLAVYDAYSCLKHAEMAGAVAYEALHATTKALDSRIHERKGYRQQQEAAENLRILLNGSEIAEHYRDIKVQDACALRAMPQIHGAVKKLLDEACEVFLTEMNSCSDNPLILETEDGMGEALMNGNFDGSFVATHADMLTIACANLAGLVERITDRLMNHHVNEGLPSFLIPNAGVNNGFMIIQYTQAALTAELKLLAAPASPDSITTCAGQEDPVSMAYRAGQKAYEAAEKLKYMVALELFAAEQAIDMREESERESEILAAIHDKIRETIPVISEDAYLHEYIERMYELVDSQELIRLVEDKTEA